MECWRIMHWITGADYVHLEHGAHLVRRVRYTAAGRPYVHGIESSDYVWLDAPGRWTVTPLTLRRQPAQ